MVKKEFFSLNSVPSPPPRCRISAPSSRSLTKLGDVELERAFDGLAGDADELTDVAAIADSAAPSADSDNGIRHLRTSMEHLRMALTRAVGNNKVNKSKREAGLLLAEPELRAAAAAAASGAMRNADNAERAQCCLALLLFSQGCVMLKQRRSEQARAYFAEAIELRPGLSDDRRDQGRLYHAYAQYAVAKDLLKNRRFGEAQAAFESLLDATGDAIKLLTSEQLEAAEGYLEQCKASRSVEAIKTVRTG